MTEKNGPKELVNFAGAAEDAIAEAVRAYREAGIAPNPSDEREKT